MLSPGPRAGCGGESVEGSGRGLQMEAAAPGQVWAAAPGSRLLLPGPRDQDQGTAARGPPGGVRPRQAGGITSCSESKRQVFSHFHRLLSAKPHTRGQKPSQSLQPRGPPSCLRQYHLPLPKSQSHPPSKTGSGAWPLRSKPAHLADSPIPGVDPGLETCLLWVLLGA